MTYQQKRTTGNWIKNVGLVLMLFWIKADVSDVRDAVKRVPIIEEKQAQAVLERDAMKEDISTLSNKFTLGFNELNGKVDNVYSLLDEWGFKQAMK